MVLQTRGQQERLRNQLNMSGATGAAAAAAVVLDPITPYASEITIDMKSEKGRKNYDYCKKGLTTYKCDATHKSNTLFMAAVQKETEERRLSAICRIQVTGGDTVYLLVQPGKISMEDLKTHCNAIWAGVTPELVQKQM
jgi:hypothetical protein